MNALRPTLVLPLLLATATFSPLASAGTNQYWNPGGDGIWGTSPGDKNWNTTPGAPIANTFWPNSLDDIAVFQDTLGGIVTVFDPIDTAGIRQTGADYTINAGTITLVPDAGGIAPYIDVQSGTLKIDSQLAGSNGLIKDGTMDLVLSGSNTYTGTTSLEEGTLTLTGDLSSTTVKIAAGTTFTDQSGGLADGTALTNQGDLTVIQAETVRTYAQSGDLNGPGSLTVTNGATLSGGTVAGTLLGDTTVSDSVVISGTTGGGTLTLTEGRLQIAGTVNNPLVDVQGRHSRLSLTGDNIADTSALSIQSGGRLDMIGDDTVDTASIAGTVSDAGKSILTASTYTLWDLSLIHISEPTRQYCQSRMPSSA